MANKRSGKGGFKEREFDDKVLSGLCHIHCTYKEICSILETDKRVLDKWCKKTLGISFDDYYKKYAEEGKASLRRNQLKLSQKNAAMAIWLGKQMLQQKDLQRFEHVNIDKEEDIIQND